MREKKDVVLENYSGFGQYIILDQVGYHVQPQKAVKASSQGIGGFGEDGNLYGIYVEQGQCFILVKGKSYEVIPSDIVCCNQYITKTMRSFRLEIKKKKICEVNYEPYIDPGMLYYDAEEDEFDFLLYLSGILKNEETIKQFIDGNHQRIGEK